jgi:aminopeptidase N
MAVQGIETTMGRGPLFLWLTTVTLLVAVRPSRAGEPPPWLPSYDLDIQLETARRVGKVIERITWTNKSDHAIGEIVLNTHAHYTIPDDDAPKIAKILEMLRMAPSEAMSFDGPALDVQHVHLVVPGTSDPQQQAELKFYYRADNPTALVVPLPRPLQPEEAVTLELYLTLKIPPKKGRWGQWDGVTTLAQWLPVVAVYGKQGWDPAPFIPWHQPFHNEAGHYTARVTLPADQKLACSGIIEDSRDLGDGRRQHVIAPVCLRDFALICSARFQEHLGKAGQTRIRVLALPEHEFYARKIVETVSQSIPVYNRWFGDYPYPQFTVVESHFGWNGNECGSLVMIDYRMFGMPHVAHAYVDYLVAHELCHQWWYGVVGTNGYSETFMDEGLATYFSHRLVTEKVGRDNKLLDYPRSLEWLPNITREDFRNYGYEGVRARGEIFPTVQDMPKYGHLANLSAYAYRSFAATKDQRDSLGMAA